MVTGRARESRETELGLEVKCSKCEEFWPCDAEFFFISKGKVHSWCKACYFSSEAIHKKRERWKAKLRAATAQARAGGSAQN